MSKNLSNDAQAVAASGTDAPTLTLAMLRNSPDCVKLLNSEGRISFMSENGMCAMDVDDHAQVAGKTWWDLWPADQRKALEVAFADAISGQDATHSGRCPTAKGRERDWSVALTPVFASNGEVSSVLAVSRDVTPTG